MTPVDPDERDRQLLDGLLKSFGEMSVAVARMQERQDSLHTTIAAVRAAHRDEVLEIKGAVRDTGVACKRRIDQLEQAMKAEGEKAEAKRVRNEVTFGQKIALTVAGIGIFLGPVVTLLVR